MKHEISYKKVNNKSNNRKKHMTKMNENYKKCIKIKKFFPF